jgi:DNA-binding SARP family transcriptional activator
LASLRESATKSLRGRYGPSLLEFRILGPLEVVGEAGALRLGGPKRRGVLAILLLNANRVVPIDRLADDLYGDATPASAVTQLQGHVSQLRKLLDPDRPAGAPGSLLETREPGYLIKVAPEQIDLQRFERQTEDALRALARGDAADAAASLRRALDLWRGPALADLADEPFAQPAIARLEELRLAALEQRIEAELALGRHLELVGELETLVSEYPFREGLRGQLMLALYRSGRQTDALAAYREARRALVESFGVEPTPTLQELERAILRQDRALELARDAAGPVPAELHGLLVVERGAAETDAHLQLASTLLASAERELIVVRLVGDERELAPASAELSVRRRALGLGTRTAAFVSQETAEDIVRLARTRVVDLVLLSATAHDLAGDGLPAELAAVFERSPADVGLVVGARVELRSGGGAHVPFGGGEHDWAALELAAWLASAADIPLRLLGTASDPRGRRDASRLLADASLAVQRVVGVEAEPLLVEPAEEALVAAVEQASVVVVGIAERWRAEGVGRVRRALVRYARPPVVLVHRGLRPGGLAPRETSTRFTWSIDR